MASSLKQVVQEMCRRATGDSIGRSVAITGLAAQTVTASSMAPGTVSAQKFINKWLWRPDQTSQPGDRFRVCSGYASSTGVFTHVGAAYADTTITGESLLILEYEPQLIFDAIQVTLERTRHIAATVIPTRANEDRYPVSQLFSWIVDPKDVQRVALSGAPWLNNNRRFQQWSTYQSDGTFNPDFWVQGGGSVVVRSSTYTRRGPYVCSLARSGADATLGQAFSLQLNGVAADDLVGETVFVVGVGLATVASRLRFSIVAGATTGSTSYHTGGSTWEELSTSITIPASATDITVRAEVNTGNTTAYIDELYAVRTAALQDAYRRGFYEEQPFRREDYHWEQFPGGIMLVLNEPRSRDQQIVIYSERPYPRFVQSRIDAGTGDLDSTDCPIEILAVGALAKLHEGLSQRPGEDGSKHARLADTFEQQYETMALAHKGGIIRTDEAPIPSPRLASPAGRW